MATKLKRTHQSLIPTLQNISQFYENGKLTPLQQLNTFYDRIHRFPLNAFIHVPKYERLEKLAEQSTKRWQLGKPLSALDGLFVAVKDNIAVRDMPLTCASKSLQDYISPFDADVIERLKLAGCIIIGKTNLDEFGLGGTGTNSYFGATRHPFDILDSETLELGNNLEYRVPGGSSGGSACALAAHLCHFSLGSDTGGSVRLPAAYCGLVGYKPPFGRLSRYGLVAYDHSIESIGFMTHHVSDLKMILDQFSGPIDARDATHRQYHDFIRDETKLEIGFLPSCVLPQLKQHHRDALLSVMTLLESAKLPLKQVDLSFPLFSKESVSLYYWHASTSALSNLLRYAIKSAPCTTPLLTESSGVSDQVTQRLSAALQSYSTSHDSYPCHLQQLNQLVARLFPHHCSLFLTPAYLMDAKEISQQKDHPNLWMNDIFHIIPSLTGMGALTLPVRDSAVQLVSPHENTILNVAMKIK